MPNSEHFHSPNTSPIGILTRNHDWSLPIMAFGTRCHTHPTTQGLVSLLYSPLLGFSHTQDPSYCEHWESEFGVMQSPEDWNKMWKSLFHSSCNVVALENSFKIMSKWYYTPARIVKYLPTYFTLFRGCSDQGNMKHI